MSQRESSLFDPLLGRLTFNERLDWYEGAIALVSGQTVKIAVDASSSEFDAVRAQAGKHLPSLLNRIDGAREFAAQRLLKVKNESWLEVGEDPLDADSFKARLAVESISMFADGDCELYLGGELFGEHAVLLRWDPQRGFYDADLLG
jgi:hypothetical protein